MDSPPETGKPCSLIGRNLLTLKDVSADEIQTLLWTAIDLKTRIKAGETYHPLVNKSVAYIYPTQSTRTKLAIETGVALLGGKACTLGAADSDAVSDCIKCSAKVLSGLVDLIVDRVYHQEELDVLAGEVSVPIVSGLSDTYHPLQVLADFATLQEHFGSLQGLKLAWVGDRKNVMHSLMMACPKLGMDLCVATPPGYECSTDIIRDAAECSEKHGTKLSFTTDPLEAIEGADVVVSSMSSNAKDHLKRKHLETFKSFQVTREMCEGAAPGWVFLHGLPRKPEEVDYDVFNDKERSLVWKENENRKWTVMSVILHLLQDHIPATPKPNF